MDAAESVRGSAPELVRPASKAKSIQKSSLIEPLNSAKMSNLNHKTLQRTDSERTKGLQIETTRKTVFRV